MENTPRRATPSARTPSALPPRDRVVVIVTDQEQLDAALAVREPAIIWIDASGVLNVDATGAHEVVARNMTRLRAAGDAAVIVADDAAVFVVESSSATVNEEGFGMYRDYGGYTTVRGLPVVHAMFPEIEGWTHAVGGTVIRHISKPQV